MKYEHSACWLNGIPALGCSIGDQNTWDWMETQGFDETKLGGFSSVRFLFDSTKSYAALLGEGGNITISILRLNILSGDTILYTGHGRIKDVQRHEFPTGWTDKGVPVNYILLEVGFEHKDFVKVGG